MECTAKLTHDNVQLVLFTLDAYGVLEPGKFILIARKEGERVAVLTSSAIDVILRQFDEFSEVKIVFECDKELAHLLGRHMKNIIVRR